tara:strand:- start:87 stop:458 length:372 start_codon:yes stop_codon:yes gene_type:complete
MFMDSEELAEIAAEACDELKAKNIHMIRIDEVSSLAEWILITEGLSDVQVRSIIRSVEDSLKQKAGIVPLRKEGVNEGNWALLDYGDLIVNVLKPQLRAFYNLEAFWSNGQSKVYSRTNPNQT